MDFVRDHLIAIFIVISIVIMVVRLLSRISPNDPAKMQLLMGREAISDDEFHSRYYADVPKMLVTAARVLFANRAHVPHKLLLPTDRLADFGIQDHADQVMAAIQKQPGYEVDVTMPVTRVETLDDVIKLERWAIAQRAMQKEN